MSDRFEGSFDALKQKVESLGIPGEWQTLGSGVESYTTVDGAKLNWWPTTKTIQFQGKSNTKEAFQNAFNGSDAGVTSANSINVNTPQVRPHIFLVHGHDTSSLDQLELALRRLELDPFILMNSSGHGKTIIEALEGKIGHDFSSDFGIVLMTPDDKGYAERDGEEKLEPRARQNVILETGMLLASLTRQRMAILVKGHVELPSDLQGIIQLRFNNHVREIVPKLCTRLSEAGISIDSSKISAASA
jgi:predicted nucleotide-binding protein